jgi:transcriptional regulator with XRE-family HTH domain
MNKFQRIALAEKDLTIKRLCQVINRHPNYVSNVFAGRYPSPELRVKIAIVLNKPVSYLWPDHETLLS